MFKSLYWKLTLAFALIAFTTAALVAIFIRITSADRLTKLIVEQQRSNLEQTLDDYYELHGSWQGVAANWRQLQFLSFPTPANSPGERPRGDDRPPASGRENLLGLADAAGVVVVPVDPAYPQGSQASARDIQSGAAVVVDGKQVGTILTGKTPPEFNRQEFQFLNRTTQALIYGSLGALLIALILGIVLSRTVTRPLKDLTQAAQRIAQGELEQQVTVRSTDEIGQLAQSFNRMSQEVARANQSRRQMTADIAHDLRTPLTVISGYVESMRDDVLKPTPERLSLIYSEIERLQNLVGDLRMLSLAEAGELSLNPQALPPKGLLEHTALLFRHQAEQQGVAIEVDASEDLPAVRVDEARMMQVLGNLITNSLRYTSSGGTILLSAKMQGEKVEIGVQDNGEGIEAEELPYIFNRFHRGDKSRHSEMGESGLGLAIVKALVELHGGSVSAESTPGQGTAIHILFPAKTGTS